MGEWRGPDGGRGGASSRRWFAAAALAASAALLAAVALQGGDQSAPGGRRSAPESVDPPARRAPLRAPMDASEPGEAAGAGLREAAADAPVATPDLIVTARDASTGARVLDFWVERGGVRDLGAPSPPPLARSDPDTGEARLERSTQPAPLRVRARRYSVWRGTEPGPPGERVVASLQRATTLHGFVRDDDGIPVAGARVELEWYGEGTGGLASDAEPKPFSGSTLRTAGEDGSYEFSGLAPGVWRTRVPWLGGATSTSQKQLLEAGEWRVADHWLGARTRVVATVTGPRPGAPPSRVIVSRARDAEVHVASGYTDETGAATLGPLPEGSYTVSVQSSSGEASPREIDVEASSPPSVTIVFELGSREDG